jgi:hypothetical protein
MNQQDIKHMVRTMASGVLAAVGIMGLIALIGMATQPTSCKSLLSIIKEHRFTINGLQRNINYLNSELNEFDEWANSEGCLGSSAEQEIKCLINKLQ